MTAWWNGDSMVAALWRHGGTVTGWWNGDSMAEWLQHGGTVTAWWNGYSMVAR